MAYYNNGNNNEFCKFMCYLVFPVVAVSIVAAVVLAQKGYLKFIFSA